MPIAEQIKVEQGRGGRMAVDHVHSDSLLKENHESKNNKLSSLHRRGAVLFSEGQQARGVYVLRAGRAKVSISSSEGKIWIVRIAQPGDLLGLNSAIKDSPYDATVEAIEPCCTNFIPRMDFIDLLDRSKRVRTEVTEALSRELTEVVEHARSLLLPKSASEKLARLLLKWCDNCDEVGPEGIRVSLRLTHEEIAQMICASRETVTRILAEFKRKQIVSFLDNAILVRDHKALEALAG